MIPWNDKEFNLFLQDYFSRMQNLAITLADHDRFETVIFDKITSPIIYLDDEYNQWKRECKQKPQNPEETSYSKAYPV